ncbi:MAG: hypothetical protein K0S30_1861 [Clostridia bacterium]|nr:hypothetical protein [Clostridia bacterium]
MPLDKNHKLFMAKIITIIAIIGIIWTSIVLYKYYTGPLFKIDTYMNHLVRKEYEKIYEMLDQEEVANQYTAQEITAYYKRAYDIENILVQMTKNNDIVFKHDSQNPQNKIGFCNIQYVYSSHQKIEPLYFIKRKDGWKIKFPFLLSEVKIHAPIGSMVYINAVKVENYENEIYVEKEVLPGKYAVRVEFPNQMYNDYNKVISVPEEKEVFLPYDTLNVEIMTIKDVIVELQGIQKKSVEGAVNFNNILEGHYKLKVFSPNDYINPREMNIMIDKNARLFSIFDITLSDKGENKLREFINGFYKGYLQDIKQKKLDNIMAYMNKDTQMNVGEDFKKWFIENKDVRDAKIEVELQEVKIDEKGLLHSSIIEMIELTNNEFDEYENRNVDRDYKIVLEWDSVMDIGGDKWSISDRKIKQSIVSYKDEEGKWVQY